jgi:hypothetical protein
MKTFDVYFGDRWIGSVLATCQETAWREATYKFHWWCGGQGDAIRVHETRAEYHPFWHERECAT